MVVQPNLMLYTGIGLILGIPAAIIVVGGLILINFKRSIMAIIQVSPKDFRLARVKPKAGKLNIKIDGQDNQWTIVEEPYSIQEPISFGKVPCYYAVVGQTKTSLINYPKPQTITSADQAEQEKQTVLRALMELGPISAMGIMMGIVGLCVGALLGYIVAGFITNGATAGK